MLALNDINLDIIKGEVHALIGENGAGKSTLIKTVSGIDQADAGEIFYRGEKLTKQTSVKSKSIGISVIYQELDLIPYLNAYENICLGNEPRTKIGFIDEKKCIKRTQVLLDELGADVPINVPVNQLSIAKQQLVMIAKAISMDPELIVMDEPTATLVEKDVKNLFNTIARMKAKGITIVYISHRLEEIFEVADRVTVLRDGEVITTQSIYDVNKSDLIKYMIGRELKFRRKEYSRISDKKVLEVKNICRKKEFEDISFDLFEGEILGISGLVGAGRTEIVCAIFGATRIDSGEIWVQGEKKIIKSPLNALHNGIGYVSEDRKNLGLLMNMNIRQNASISALHGISKLGFINKHMERMQVKENYDRLRVKANSDLDMVNSLSGGNQQKVVLIKWLMANPKILIIDEPTRGIDVGAKEEIYELINKLKANGFSIIIISSEMPEIIRMSDRVLVICEGHVVGELNAEEIEEENIMKLCVAN